MKSNNGTVGWRTAWILLLSLTLLVALVPGAPVTLADGGDFSVNFAAAGPFTYSHNTSMYSAPPPPAAWPGGGAWNDGDSKGEGADIREELEGGSFQCKDTVSYLAKIDVDAGAIPLTQTIVLQFAFLLDTTGQTGAGLVSTAWGGDPDSSGGYTNAAINYGYVQGGDGGVDTTGDPSDPKLDSGINDDRQTIALGDTESGGSVATVVDQYFRDKQGDREGDPAFDGGLFQDLSELVVVIQVDDLEPGETVILRIDTRIECKPGSDPTGNLQAKYESGYVIEEDGVPTYDAIGSGAQTIPFKQIGQLQFNTNYGILKDCQEEVVVEPGDSFSFVLTVYNDGPIAATSLQVTDPLPSVVAYDSVVTDKDVYCGLDGCCSYDPGTHTVTCNLDLLTLDSGTITNNP